MARKKVKLTDLIPDDHNANRGTDRGAEMIRRSLEKFGFAEAGTLDRNNRIVGGNKRTEAAADAGMSDDVIIIDVDGTKPVYIRRTDIDLETPEGRELAIALNRTAQVSIDFDADQLAEEMAAGVDTGDWFEDEELRTLSLMQDANSPAANDWQREWTGMPEFVADDITSFRRIIMHFMTPEALADFKLKIDQDFSDTARFIYHPKEEHDVQPDYVPDDEED